ncbi:MAG: transcriptional repressor NrdR [Clostridia bacterium]|nr:transcriptional repressor NrdR [Clostridia bacterium]
MRCPFCGSEDNKVVDSRPVEESNSIRRRRECLNCQKRFNTYEVVESVQLIVCKKSGLKELYDHQKLLSGVLKATQKRPVNAEALVNEIELELQNSLVREVTSRELGEMVMNKLKERDEVSYVRFASVYKEFKDVDTFLEALKSLRHSKKKAGAGKKTD